MDKNLLTDEINQLHAELCSAMADPRRIMMLYMLEASSQSVNEISDKIGLSQPATSRHLKVLRDAGLVRATRQGMNVEYSLADGRLIEALDLLRLVLRDRIRHRANLMNINIEG